jgi:ADP-ribose pyrophosphatase YjhB (NUDIX family)
MPSRPAPLVALVCCTLVNGALAVLMTEGSERRSGELPTAVLPLSGNLEATATALATASLGRPPSWMMQSEAVATDGLVVAYATVVPLHTAAPAGFRWVSVAEATATSPLVAALVASAIAELRDRLDREPVAFRLLGATFTLSDLQRVYEVLLERRLHKASFRRTLLAAHLVEPTESWRSEGRGRPAQLFRFAPRRRRGVQRSVRFELLSS